MRRSTVALAVGLALTPIGAGAVLIADGVSYTLNSATTANPLTRLFALTITGHNSASDTEGGRSGINAIAFNHPGGPGNNVISGTMIAPPAGFAFQNGGLNAAGCDGSGNFFCFDNTAIPPIPGTALATTPIVFVFSLTVGAGGSFGSYFDADSTNDAEDPSFKIDWVGTQNNYDLVSLPIDVGTVCPECTPTPFSNPTPEPATLALMGLGLFGLTRFRRKK